MIILFSFFLFFFLVRAQGPRAAGNPGPPPAPRVAKDPAADAFGGTRVPPPFQPPRPPGKGAHGAALRRPPPLGPHPPPLFPVPARGRGPRRGGEEARRAEAGGRHEGRPLPSRPPFPPAGLAPPPTDRDGRSGNMRAETRSRSHRADGGQPPRVGRGRRPRGAVWGSPESEGGRKEETDAEHPRAPPPPQWRRRERQTLVSRADFQ